MSALVTRVFAVDQIKTTETYIGASTGQVSGQTDLPFSLYIGDNISGVATSVKSVFVTVSGVYTGSGSVQAKLDGDTATAQTFALPNVGSTPTPFEVLYKDGTGTIAPATPGTYAYTLNVIPSGVTISALGAKATMTYRYEPGSCDDGQPSSEKIKTTETYIGASTGQVSGQTDLPFSLYIGDNISGVATSVKSVFVTVSGVYTGSGSVQAKLDGDTATAQTFALPNVGSTPTPFEVLYKDGTGTIAPATPGTYAYTLNVIPSGVTISALGAKATMTYRYKPPACGGGYPPTGDVTSAIFDTTIGGAYNSIAWKGVLGGPAQNQGKVRFQFASSNDSGGPWNYIGGATCSSGDWYDPGTQSTPIEISCSPQYHNNQRYYRYKVQICSQDCSTSGSYTPTVQDVVVSWAP